MHHHALDAGHKMRKLISLLAVCLLLVQIGVTTPGASASGAERSTDPLAASSDYVADFKGAKAKGVGFRLIDQTSDHYVDIRLKGHPGIEGRSLGTKTVFDIASNIRADYEETPGRVSQSIIMTSTPFRSEFRFALKASGLKPQVSSGAVVFTDHADNVAFTLSPALAWDGDGNKIPAKLVLDGTDAVISLDPAVLATAKAPVTVDPTLSGTPLADAAGPNTRRVVNLADGRLVFFGVEGASLKYRISTNGGATWGTPVTFADTGGQDGIDVVKVGGDLLVSYWKANALAVGVAFKTLEPQGAGFVAGPESIVAASDVYWDPRPSLVYRSDGLLGRRLAVGYSRYDRLRSRHVYSVSFSEDSGKTWTPAIDCDTEVFNGRLVVQGAKLTCLTFRWWQKGIKSFEYLGTAFAPTPTTLPGDYPGNVPSSVLTYDGKLHLVYSESADPYYVTGRTWSVFHITMAPDGTVAREGPLGPGRDPVVSTQGASLHVFAADRLSSQESYVRSYIASDGVRWASGRPLSGRAFTKVIDRNDQWVFTEHPSLGDLLFGFSGTTITPELGNLIGTSQNIHLLDAQDEKISFSFVPAQNADVTDIKLWTKGGLASPRYRFGIQKNTIEADPSMSVAAPSGNWATTNSGSLAYTDISVPSTPLFQQIQIPMPTATHLNAGWRYHVVIEPAPATMLVPGLGNELSVEATGAATQGKESFVDLGYAGGTWTQYASEVPRIVVLAGASSVIDQPIGVESAAVPYEQVSEYSHPGQSFTVASAVAPSAVGVLVRKTGNPTGQLTLRLVDVSNPSQPEVWSSSASPTSDGWLSIPFTATLQPSVSYRLVVDSTSRDPANYFSVARSGDAAASFKGTASFLTRSIDRKGDNDRTIEASTNSSNPSDFSIFNSGTSDALYVADDEKFNYATLVRQLQDQGTQVSLDVSYFNGAWTPVPVASFTRNDLGTPRGAIDFTPPGDWAKTTVSGTNAYWLKITNASGLVALLIDRTSSIRNHWSPSVAGESSETVPLVYVKANYTPALDFMAYDGAAPSPNGLEARPNPFTPDGDGVLDVSYISSGFTEPVDWSVQIHNQVGAPVGAAVSGTGQALQFGWDGRDQNGMILAPGAYKAVVRAVDLFGNTSAHQLWVTSGTGPVIGSVAPATVQIGERMTVTGSGFGSGSGIHGVSIDGVAAHVVGWSDTEIVFDVPAGLEPGVHDLSILQAGIESPVLTITVAKYSVAPATSVTTGHIQVRVKQGVDAASLANEKGDGVPVPMFASDPDALLSRWYQISVPSGAEASKAIDYASDDRVEFAEATDVPSPAATYPNDPERSKQWGLDDPWDPTDPDARTTNSTWNVDIDAPEAWALSTGSSSVTIGVIDSGIGSHADITANLAQGGIDYTGSGTTNEGCTSGHGTMVAGIAAADTGNGIGIAGAGYSSRVRAYKVFKDQPSASGIPECRWSATTSLARVLADASRANDVVNVSLTHKTYSQAEQDAVNAGWDAGAVFVAAAGNDGSTKPVYPAALDHVLAVGALDQQGNRSQTSNYNSQAGSNRWVDVFAPGEQILATSLDPAMGYYSYMSGTSAAAAFVAGTAALMFARPENPTNVAVVTGIMETTDLKSQLLSAYGALLEIHNVIEPTGTFAREKGRLRFYFLDRDPTSGMLVKRLARAEVLQSWGISFSESKTLPYINELGAVGYDLVNGTNHKVWEQTAPDGVDQHQIVELEPEQLENFRDGQHDLGFRPGSLVSTSAAPDPATSVIYAITNDQSSNDQYDRNAWTGGVKRQVAADAFSCLGYNEDRIIAGVAPKDLALHDNGASVQKQGNDCAHPNGAVVADGDIHLLDRNVYIIEGQKLRSIPDLQVMQSWGMGSSKALVSDVTAMTPMDTQTLTVYGSSDPKVIIGMRPGVALLDDADGVTTYVVTSEGWASEGSDFARAMRRKIDSKEAARCYGTRTLVRYSPHYITDRHKHQGPNLAC